MRAVVGTPSALRLANRLCVAPSSAKFLKIKQSSVIHIAFGKRLSDFKSLEAVRPHWGLRKITEL